MTWGSEVNGWQTDFLQIYWAAGLDDGFTRVVREAHLLSCMLTSALPVWLMVRTSKSAGGSAELRSRRGWNMGEGGETGRKTRCDVFWEEKKYSPLSLFLLRRSRPKGSVMIGPSGLFCLATCSGEVMIASEAEEVKRRDCQQDCTENTSQVLICHSELSQSCYCFKIVVWAVTGYKSQSLKQPQPPSRSPVMHLFSLYLGFIRAIMFSWLIILPHSKSVLRVVAAYRKVHLYFTA